MTEGELLDAGLEFYLNQGSSSVLKDRDQRRKAHFYSTQTAKRLWQSAPYQFRKADGVTTLVNGVGTLPADFQAVGTQAQFYIQGQLYRPLSFKPPDWVKFQIQNSPQTGTPWAYSLYTETPSVQAQGLQEIVCWPQDNSTLDIRVYDRLLVELIDHPLAPFATVNPAAGLLNGAVSYVVTFVTSRGETEGGFVSNTVSPANEQVDLTDIPTWWGRTVTSRRVYRTAGGGLQHKLVTTIADNLTTSFTDNVADGALGVDVPLPVAAVSGLEVFPTDFHESALYEGLQYFLARGQGDGRDDRFFMEWKRAVQRQWEEIQQGQNTINAFPAFPGFMGGHPVWGRWVPPQ